VFEYHNEAVFIVKYTITCFQYIERHLTHWHFDTFELSWSAQMMLPKGKATFVLSAEGKPIELQILVDNPDFDFTELKLLRRE